MAGPQASKRRTAVTTSRSAGQASTAALLLTAAAVAGWFLWRKRKEQEEQNPNKRQPRPAGRAGGSRFKFPSIRSGGGSSSRGNSSSKQQGSSTITLPPVHPSIYQQQLPKGNPKKDKNLRRQRKQEKQARKQTKEAMQTVSAKAGSEDDGPKTVKYVDMSKTSDAYDKVREWQETGKKRYP